MDGTAILAVLVYGTAMELDAIDFLEDLGGEPGAVYAVLRVSSIHVAHAQPLAGFDEQGPVVGFFHIETEGDACACQLAHVHTEGVTSAVRTGMGGSAGGEGDDA